jgi:hypothetical protein
MISSASSLRSALPSPVTDTSFDAVPIGQHRDPQKSLAFYKVPLGRKSRRRLSSSPTGASYATVARETGTEGESMSDVAAKTAVRAVRVLFVALGFIFIVLGLGLEATTDRPDGQFTLGLILFLLGALCFCAVVFWDRVAKNLDVKAQLAIADFARSRNTWLGLCLTILLALIFSPFIEQHRWPFSFPTDPAVYEQLGQTINAMNALEDKATIATQDAEKWRFSFNLRNETKDQDGRLLECPFSAVIAGGDMASGLWDDLEPMLDLAHWHFLGSSVVQADIKLNAGFTILIGANSGNSLTCATALTRQLATIFSSQAIRMQANRVTPALANCKNECVEIDIGN